MKVCILTSAHSALDDRVFHKEAKSLAAAGHEVVVVAPHERDEKRNGVSVIAVRRASNRLTRMGLTVIRVLLKARETKADVFHFHDPELIPAGLILRALGKRVIYDIHEYNAEGVLDKAWLPRPTRWAVSRLVEMLDNLAVSRMDGVVVVTDDMAERFLPLARGTDRLVTAKNYPSVGMWEEPEGDPPRENVAIYVGRLTRGRGLEVLIRAGEILQRQSAPVRIRVLGPVEFAGVSEAFANLTEWSGRGVDYAGVVPHENVAEMVTRAKIGLVPFLWGPTLERALPIKLFEYMAAGVPVVVSDFGVMGRIVRDVGCGVVVPPGDPQALAAAIGRLIADPSLLAELGARGRAAARKEYNWDSEVRKLLDLYERVRGSR